VLIVCICDLKPGQKALIHKIIGDEKLKNRLNALGCIEGTEIELKSSAPLGDPLVINLRGFNLAIRKNDAKNIFIRGEQL
jgi:ferrous iron transport protein A